MKKRDKYHCKMRKPRVFVGIVHYGRTQLLLDTLSNLDSNELNIWVINHNKEPLDWLDENIACLWDASNPGYAAGMNKLLYQAQLERADYAIFLTNDIELLMPNLRLWVEMLKNSSHTLSNYVP